MWWWSNYGVTGWMFFGPMMMLVFMAMFTFGIFFAVRATWYRKSAFWRNEPPASGHSAFERYRTDTLQRLDEEQRQFQEFFVQLRMAKDKAEFDQFIAERRK